MNKLLRTVCLTVYALALVGLFVDLPFDLAPGVQYAAAILLGAHLLETLLAFKSVRRYPGSLAVSIALSLLFGLLHWLPLAKENARATK